MSTTSTYVHYAKGARQRGIPACNISKHPVPEMAPQIWAFLLPAMALAASFIQVPELQRLWEAPNSSVALPNRAWLGGDSDWSIPLPNGSSVWIFGDTFVGAYDAPTKQRVGSGMAMPHDTIAMVAPAGLSAQKWWNTSSTGQPVAWFRPLTSVPGGEDDYLWIMSGIATPQGQIKPQAGQSPQGLTILGSRVRANGSGAFGFEIVSTTVVSVADISAGSPGSWEYSTCDFNATGFKTGLFWHSDIFPEPENTNQAEPNNPMMLVVGQRQDPSAAMRSVRSQAEWARPRSPGDVPRAGILMKIPLASLARCSYLGAAVWTLTGWQSVSDASPPNATVLASLFEPDDSELTITPRPLCGGGGWFSAYIPFLSDTLRIRTAPTPTGPWTDDATATMQMPWPANDTSEFFSYAAKAHPELDAAWGGSCGSVLTYVTNAQSFGTLFQPGMAGVYTPQVWRVNWT